MDNKLKTIPKVNAHAIIAKATITNLEYVNY